MKEIETREDIIEMVNGFYDAVRKDELLGPVFNEVIKDKWEEHLNTMYNFWQTVLLHEHAYKGAPFIPHRNLPVSERHFQRWLALFNENLKNNFTGVLALEAQLSANKIARMFMIRMFNDY